MKKYKKYLTIIILFIVFDAFHRSISYAIYIGEEKNSIVESVRALLFYMLIFIFKSWFYFPIAVFFLLISKLFKKDQYFFMAGGLITALLFYLFYCRLYSILEVGRPEFYFRIVMYSLMGAYFGSVRFKTIQVSA